MDYIPRSDYKLHSNRVAGPILAIAGILAALLSLTPVSGTAGSLSGQVRLTASPPRTQSANIDPYAGTLGSMRAPEAGSHDHSGNTSEVVVYLEGSLHADGVETDHPKLYQINQRFEPRVLGVPVGAVVDFPNKDNIFHNVFSYSKTKRFDLGYYGQNKSKSVRFDKPGLVKVFCDIHSNMAAFIYVVDTPFVTQPKDDGAYRLDDVPNGTYTLKVWHPDRGMKSQEITISGSTRHDIDI